MLIPLAIRVVQHKTLSLIVLFPGRDGHPNNKLHDVRGKSVQTMYDNKTRQQTNITNRTHLYRCRVLYRQCAYLLISHTTLVCATALRSRFFSCGAVAVW